MVYRTKSGDTWDTIAREVYGDEYKAGVLMEANRGHIGVFQFSAGVELTTPEVETADTAAGTVPWKEG